MVLVLGYIMVLVLGYIGLMVLAIMVLAIMVLAIMVLAIMVLAIMVLAIMVLAIMVLAIMVLAIMVLRLTSIVAKLPAHYSRLPVVPLVIAHGAPQSFQTHLHSSIVGSPTINQTYVSLIALVC